MNPRLTAIAVALTALLASPASAQAPPTPPLVFHLPSSARTTALGSAWVAGRDAEVIFHNPAQLIGSRQEFGVTITRPGQIGMALSSASAYAAGKYSLTLGWGIQVADFRANAAAAYPYASDALLEHGSADGQSTLLTFGGAIVYKNFRIGGAAKYASDRVATLPGGAPLVAIDQHAWLADVGVARNVLGGVAAFSVQNLGRTTAVDASTLITPRQFLAGYSMTRAAGPFDLGMYSQVTMRKDWWSPAGGLEVGYSWIEGYALALRIGAKRPETSTEQPLTFGAAITADRLTIEYAVRFFDGGRSANVVTVRWR